MTLRAGLLVAFAVEGHPDRRKRRRGHRAGQLHVTQRQRRLPHPRDRPSLRHPGARLGAPASTGDCQFGYGQGITMAAGGVAEFVCAGDTALDAGEPLPYGESISAGALRCDSAESGITCRDTESGRGFALSRERYEMF